MYRASRVMLKLESRLDDSLFVLHKCDNPSCVRPDHLFNGTHLDNMRDCKRKGRNKHFSGAGERNPRAKLTVDQVKEIRSSPEKNNVLSKLFGVTDTQISFIKSRKVWAFVE